MDNQNLVQSNITTSQPILNEDTIKKASVLNHYKKDSRLNRLKKRFCITMYVTIKKRCEDLGTSEAYPRRCGNTLPKGKEVIIRHIDWEREVLLVETKDAKKMVDVEMSNVRVSLNQPILMRAPEAFSKFLFPSKYKNDQKIKAALHKQELIKEKEERKVQREKENKERENKEKKLALISIVNDKYVTVTIFNKLGLTPELRRKDKEEVKCSRQRDIDSAVKKFKSKYKKLDYRIQVQECTYEGLYYKVICNHKNLVKGDYLYFKSFSIYEQGYISAQDRSLKALFKASDITSQPKSFKKIIVTPQEFRELVKIRNKEIKKNRTIK